MAESNAQGTTGQALRKGMEETRDLDTKKGGPAKGIHVFDADEQDDDEPLGETEASAETEGMAKGPESGR